MVATVDVRFLGVTLFLVAPCSGALRCFGGACAAVLAAGAFLAELLAEVAFFFAAFLAVAFFAEVFFAVAFFAEAVLRFAAVFAAAPDPAVAFFAVRFSAASAGADVPDPDAFAVAFLAFLAVAGRATGALFASTGWAAALLPVAFCDPRVPAAAAFLPVTGSPAAGGRPAPPPAPVVFLDGVRFAVALFLPRALEGPVTDSSATGSPARLDRREREGSEASPRAGGVTLRALLPAAPPADRGLSDTGPPSARSPGAPSWDVWSEATGWCPFRGWAPAVCGGERP